MNNELLHCPVPRCASTAWKQFLMYLNGELADPSLHLPILSSDMIIKVYGQKAVAMTKDLGSYMTVNQRMADNRPLVSFLFVR